MTNAIAAAPSEDAAFVLKTVPPRVRRGVLHRERLRLSRWGSGGNRAILVIAPTGFGKTFQLAQWRREALAEGSLAMWLTLDARDDPLRLVRGLAQAAKAASGKQSFSEPIMERITRASDPIAGLTLWLAEVAHMSVDVLLALDDLDQAPDSTRIDVLPYLLGNAPSNLRIVFGSRTGPISSEGEMMLPVDLRVTAEDLRFRPEETLALLASLQGVRHDPEAALRLHDVTEGWPLGVQLSLAALNRVDNVEEIPASARGDIRRFFLNSMVDQQPQALRDLLVRIAPFEFVHPDLAVCLTGRSEAADDLRTLAETTPLFTLAEDSDWLRLHSVAREALEERFAVLDEADRIAIFRAASTWYVKRSMFEVGALQAHRAGDTALAFDLAERGMRQLLTSGRIGAVLEWRGRMIDSDFDSHPGFWIATAWALAMSERPADALPLLDRIEQAPEATPPMRFEAGLIRTVSASFADKADQTGAILESWLEPPEYAEQVQLPVYWNAHGFAALFQGQTDRARLYWQRVAYLERNIGVSPMTYGFADYGIALSHLWEGRCEMAADHLRPALARAESEMGRRNLVASMLAGLLARASWECGDDQEPRALLALRLDVIERQGLPDALLSAYLTLARMAVHEGRHDKALSLLEELRAIGSIRDMPRLQLCALGEMVQQHCRQGRVETAQSLAAQMEMQLAKPASHIPAGFRSMLEIKVGLARANCALAYPDIDQLPDTIEDIGRLEARARSLSLGGDLIELRILRARAMQRCGMAQFGLVRDETSSLAEMYGQRRLIQAQPEERTASSQRVSPPVSAPPRPAAQVASGSAILTAKEREILSLLAANLSNKEISRAIDLSEQTVKWHLKNLFAKLSGANRKHAVARARMLGLLPA